MAAPHSRSQDQQSSTSPNLWEFVSNAGDPGAFLGHGVDHQRSPPFPNFTGGFPFAGGSFSHRGPPHPPHHHPRQHHHPHHHHHPRHHHHHHHHPHHHPDGRGPPHPRPDPPLNPWTPDPDCSEWSICGRHHDQQAHQHGGPETRRGPPHCPDSSDDEASPSGDKTADENATEASPDTAAADPATPEDGQYPPPPPPPPPYGRECGRRGNGRFGGRRGRHAGMRHRGPHCPRGSQAFDFAGMMHGLVDHPFFQALRDQAERHRGATPAEDVDSFAPPVDVFDLEQAFVLHVALPGARKEDVGVSWNPHTGALTVSGAVHRLGDEHAIQRMVSAERRVGLFRRSVRLPPPGPAADKEDVDGFSITAKLEDGLLVVTVPKMEKEWTEVRKVDVE